VKNFNQILWKSIARQEVYNSNVYKFLAHQNLIPAHSYGKILVEARLLDCLWGIGLAHDDCRAVNRTYWRGSNWLRYVLTVSEDMLAAMKETPSVIWDYSTTPGSQK